MFTSVTADNDEECLEKCANSTACQVAAYSGTKCQHSANSQPASDGPERGYDWRQYLKLKCTTTSTANNATAKTTTNTPATQSNTSNPTTSSQPITIPNNIQATNTKALHPFTRGM